MLEYRNPTHTRSTAIDVEINHPEFGWIPFTASPDDPEAMGRELFAAITAAGDIAPFVDLEPAPYQIAKTTPWLRMTDDEAATMDGVMSQTDARLKQIYMAATYLASNDPLWATLHQMLSDQFGEERADELLAPET